MLKNKKIKKIFNLYNLLILGSIILILASFYIIFKPDKKVTPSGIEIVQTNVKDTEEITEEAARRAAIKQFKILGETKLKEEELAVTKIQREGEEYYYISSTNNTLEIKIKGGIITRINSASVEE